MDNFFIRPAISSKKTSG